MKNVIRNLHRWVLLWLAVFFTGGCLTLNAQTWTATGQQAWPSGSYLMTLTGVSASIDGSGNFVGVYDVVSNWPSGWYEFDLYAIGDTTVGPIGTRLNFPASGNSTFTISAANFGQAGNVTRVEMRVRQQYIDAGASGLIVYSHVPNEQTVFISPTSAGIGVNGSIQFQASGGQTEYEWRVIPAGPDMQGVGQLRTVTFPEEGTFSVQVRAIAGAGYAASQWATAIISVGEGKQVQINIPTNNSQFPVKWTVWQGLMTPANTMHEVTMAPGQQGYSLSFGPEQMPLGQDVPVQVAAWIYADAEWIEDSQTWQYKPGADPIEGPTTEVTPEAPNPQQPKPPIQPIAPTPPSGPPPSSTPPTTGQGPTGSVWRSQAPTPGAMYTGPTDSTFREGVGKLEKQLTEINEQKELKDLADKNPPLEQMQSTGSVAAEEAAGLIPSVAQPAPPPVITTTPDFTFTFPPIMGGASVDLNPFRADRFGPLMAWFRSAVGWSVIALFGWWASAQVKDWVQGASRLPQARGNAVFGGTGAQATALIAAGIITVAVSVFLVGLAAWLVGDFAIPAVLAKMSQSPTAGLATQAAWMLDTCFPVGTIVAAAAARATWNFFAASIFAVAMTVIRFIVP